MKLVQIILRRLYENQFKELKELSFNLIPIGQEFKKFVKNMTSFLLLMKSFVDLVELETGLDQILIILNLTLSRWPKGLPQDISHCLES